MKNIFRVIVSLIFLVCILTVSADITHAEETQMQVGGNLETSMPAKEDIQRFYRSLTLTTWNMYIEQPSTTMPYKAGKLTDEYLQTGLDFVNYVRFIANLPAVQMSEDYNTEAQHAAVVVAANGYLSHYPERPSGMEQSFYELGYAGASSSNLSRGYSQITSAVQGCLDDDGQNNLRGVGHRRWLLSPYMKYIGFGFARSTTATKVAGIENRPTYTWDQETEHFVSDSIDFDYIAWPCAGNFPTNLISRTVPWSLTLNPEKYNMPEKDQLTITITRKADGKTWTFDKSTPEPTNTRDASLIVSTENYSVPICIIFHPGSRNIDSYSGAFFVDVTGLRYLDDSPAELHYEIDFFDVTKCITHDYQIKRTDATCTRDGSAVKTCIYCGHVTTETLPAKGHSYSEWVQSAAPTCVSHGSHHRSCSACGIIEDESLAPLGHTYDGTVPVYSPPEHSHSWNCTRCGADCSERCSYDAGTVLQEPTAYAQGVTKFTCGICSGNYEQNTFLRLCGDNRFETAFRVADQMKANLGIEKFDAVVVASGTEFADALAGSYLASAKKAPILLAYNDKINEGVKDYIKANLNPGGTVYILGGEKAVPESFKDGLEEQFTVKRLAGGNRFETNLLVLEEAGVGDKPILVCTGLGFADSLSASATKLPILLVYGDKLLPEQTAFLESLQGNPMYVIGGDGAVSTKMETVLKGYGEVTRLAGGNRFETSTLIAETFFEAPKTAVLAYAWDFPDGLCGGPLAATMNAPLILTMDKYEAKAAEYIQGNAIPSGTVLGGETLISGETVNKIFN